MLVYTFEGIAVRGKGLPTKAMNIGAPRQMMIPHYLDSNFRLVHMYTVPDAYNLE